MLDIVLSLRFPIPILLARSATGAVLMAAEIEMPPRARLHIVVESKAPSFGGRHPTFNLYRPFLAGPKSLASEVAVLAAGRKDLVHDRHGMKLELKIQSTVVPLSNPPLCLAPAVLFPPKNPALARI